MRIWQISFLMAFIFTAGSSLGAEKFTFNPEDGFEFRESQTMIMTTELGMKGMPPLKGLFEVTKDVKVEKSGNNFTVTTTPVSYSNTVNGVEFKEPSMWVSANSQEKFTVSKKGKIKKITGYKEKFDELTSGLTPEEEGMYGKNFNEDYLYKTFKESWKLMVSSDVGKSTRKGTKWSVKSVMYRPDDDKLAIKVDKEVGDRVACNDKDTEIRCIVVSYTYNYNELGKDPNGVIIAGKGEKIVDPKTMILYSEKSHYFMELDVKNIGKTVTEVKSEYSIEVK